MNRRQFFHISGALAAPAVSAQRRPDILVAGAGAFGGWTAFFLREAGSAVTLADSYGAGNARSASGGESRLVRARETDRTMFRLMRRSRQLWDKWQERWNTELLVPTGYLALFDPGPTPAWIAVAHNLLDEFGERYEMLSAEEIRSRYPQIRTDDVGGAYFEPGGATARARDACVAVRRAFDRAGGSYLTARVLPGKRRGRRLLSVRLSGDKTLQADQFVFACGPWLGQVFPEAIGERLRTPRREVFFVGPPAGDPRFAHPRCPAWADRTAAGNVDLYYGFPDIDGRGFRVTPTNDENSLDPDRDERVVSPYQLKRLYDYVRQRFPSLAGQPVVNSRVCQVEYTPDKTYVVDRHPDFDNVWVVGGGSGTGFKNGPGVGEFAATRILGQEADAEFTQRFAWRGALGGNASGKEAR